jgi:hypothetical protein
MSQDNAFFFEFLRITCRINSELNIEPVLFGSLGLQMISGFHLDPQDIDVLVPVSYLQNKWNVLKTTLEDLGYQLFNLREHEFHKDGFKVAFAHEEDLLEFAGVDFRNLEVATYEGCRYRQLSLRDFLTVYSRSAQDGYRRSKNNNKDLQKIELLKTLLTAMDKTT